MIVLLAVLVGGKQKPSRSGGSQRRTRLLGACALGKYENLVGHLRGHYIGRVPAANSFDPRALAAAVQAARRALATLKDDQIPARIRSVARKSGTLPSPLAQSLIAELDRNEMLRHLALDLLVTDASAADGRQTASEEFLRREPGWQLRFQEQSARAETEAAHKAVERLEAQLTKARKEVESLRRQLRRAQGQTAQKSPRPAANKPPASNVAKAALVELERALAASDAARRELLDDLAAANDRIETLRKRRRERSAPSLGSPSGLRRRSLELARDLDARLHAISISPVHTTTELGGERARPTHSLALPAGMRPDVAAAIEWIRLWPGPLTVAVDGWNLAFHFRNPPGKRERTRVEAAVGRLSHRSAGERRLLVLFDSRFDLPGSHAGTHPRVEVRFPASADDALIELAEEEAALVVITSDRHVREEAGRRGAIGLWSEALIDWLQ